MNTNHPIPNERHNLREIKLSNGRRLRITSSKSCNSKTGLVLVANDRAHTQTFHWQNARQFLNHLHDILPTLGLHIKAETLHINHAFTRDFLPTLSRHQLPDHLIITALRTETYTEEDGKDGLDNTNIFEIHFCLNRPPADIPEIWQETPVHSPLNQTFRDLIFTIGEHYGLRGDTPLSAHTPTGRPFTTLSIRYEEPNTIIARNRTMLDC